MHRQQLPFDERLVTGSQVSVRCALQPVRLERRAAHRKSFCKRGEKTSRRLRNTYNQIKRLRATVTRRATDW
ncbi:hypothetical protein GCM10010121_044350 [Streptomyces brasiliensis]|uniref:Transposase n=1 Tax=Streptomyces brasiliensis TaxID=1954 RepID=A0A917KT46_9ACTN|nr:hypothetical protein GCM10010121_044350 [Streptomyces brasiliensis]